VARALGPGLITGAADDDPSGIITYSMAGAQHGMALLWLAWITWPLMAAVQMMCARIGMVTGKGLGEVLTLKFPRAVVVVACCALFMANTINIAADLAGMADAASMLVGLRPTLYVVLFGAGIAVAMVRCRYAVIAAVLKWLVLSLFAYVVTAFLVHPNWPEVASATFIPTLPEGPTMWQTVVAILGTTISPYLFFWQASQEVEEQRAAPGENRLLDHTPEEAKEHLKRIKIDTWLGMTFSNLIALCIMLTTAATLNAQGIVTIETATQAAQALRPIAGDFAFALFTAGIVGTGMLAIPVLAGSAAYAVAESFRWPIGLGLTLLEARGFYTILSGATLVGVGMGFTSIDPIKALYWAAVVNGVIAVPIMVVMMLLSAKPEVMGPFTSRLRLRVIGWLSTAVMAAAVIAMFATL
jgi:NRAMP (natural resistance-associated macrophage protein)-like metal ion transporter